MMLITVNVLQIEREPVAEKFGAPPESAKTRSMVEERLLQAQQDNGEKMTVEWRGQPLHMNVISMPVEALYYNPDTHRVRAQRSLDPDRNRILAEEPWGSAGQDYLDFLLKCQPSDPTKIDPDFEALRDGLKDFGQMQPGLISRSGILVNGNTRCAALREIGVRHIRVGVLPADTSRADISAVELSLQLRRENKRDYSYINYLIAMEEQLTEGRRLEDISRDFHVRAKTLEQDRWVYSVIQEVIERSTTDSGHKLGLIDFEDHQEKLRELYRSYTKEAATSRDGAESLKESRLAMIVLGFSKTDVRLAKPDFHERYLEPKLPASVRPATQSAGASIGIPGLSVSVPDATPSVRSSRTLTDTLLRAKAQSQVAQGNTESFAAAIILDEAKDSVVRALVPAGKDERLRQRKVAASDRLSDAADLVDLCTSDLAQAIATKAVDEDALDEALVRLRLSLAKMARQASRAIETPGSGLTWLTNAVLAKQ